MGNVESAAVTVFGFIVAVTAVIGSDVCRQLTARTRKMYPARHGL